MPRKRSLWHKVNSWYAVNLNRSSFSGKDSNPKSWSGPGRLPVSRSGYESTPMSKAGKKSKTHSAKAPFGEISFRRRSLDLLY